MRGSTVIFAAIAVLTLLIVGGAGVATLMSKKRAKRDQPPELTLPDPPPAVAKPEPLAIAGQVAKEAVEQQKAQPEPSAWEAWNAAEIREPAQAVYTAYQGNAVAADRKYKGKRVALTGVVQKVDTDPLGHGVLVLTVGEELFEVMTCTFDKAHTDPLGDVPDGSAVAVVGECKGRAFLGVALDHCRLVQKAANPDALAKLLAAIPKGK